MQTRVVSRIFLDFLKRRKRGARWWGRRLTVGAITIGCGGRLLLGATGSGDQDGGIGWHSALSNRRSQGAGRAFGCNAGLDSGYRIALGYEDPQRP